MDILKLKIINIEGFETVYNGVFRNKHFRFLVNTYDGNNYQFFDCTLTKNEKDEIIVRHYYDDYVLEE